MQMRSWPLDGWCHENVLYLTRSLARFRPCSFIVRFFCGHVEYKAASPALSLEGGGRQLQRKRRRSRDQTQSWYDGAVPSGRGRIQRPTRRRLAHIGIVWPIGKVSGRNLEAVQNRWWRINGQVSDSQRREGQKRARPREWPLKGLRSLFEIYIWGWS